MVVKLSDGDTGSAVLEAITLAFATDLSGGEYIGTAEINITDGALSAGITAVSNAYTLSGISHTLNATNPTYDRFDMLCCSFANWSLNNGISPNHVTNVAITVTCDGVRYWALIPAGTFKPGGLLAGKQYTVTLKLQREVGVTANQITVNEWGSTNSAGSTDENQVVAPT